MEKVDDDFSDIVKVKELGWMGWGWCPPRSVTLMAYHHYRTVSDPKTRFA